MDLFIFFVDTVKAMQASDPLGLQNFTQRLDFHAEQRQVEIGKEKMEKASARAAS